MTSNRVKLYPSDNVIDDFYEALASKSEKKLKKFTFLNQMFST